MADFERLAISLGGGTIYSSPLWHRCWWRYFAGRGDQLWIHRLYAGGELAGAIPLIHHDRLLRSWAAPRNSHSIMVDVTWNPACPQIWQALLAEFAESAHVLELGPIAAKSATSLALIEAARELDLKCATTPVTPLAILDLSGGWEPYRAKVSHNLIGNTERVQRRLTGLGRLDFQEHQGGPDLPALLRECFELEARTWKGAEGSAIVSSPATLGFYTDLVMEAAAAGELSLYTLRLDARLIAFDLCLRRGQWIHDLKFSYEPEMSRYAPCNVLRYLFLKREFESPRARWYELGMQCEWKARWTSTLPLEVVRVYAPGPRAGAAWLAGPVLRRRLKAVESLHQAVEALRGFRSRARSLRRTELKRSLREAHPDKPTEDQGA